MHTIYTLPLVGGASQCDLKPTGGFDMLASRAQRLNIEPSASNMNFDRGGLAGGASSVVHLPALGDEREPPLDAFLRLRRLVPRSK